MPHSKRVRKKQLFKFSKQCFINKRWLVFTRKKVNEIISNGQIDILISLMDNITKYMDGYYQDPDVSHGINDVSEIYMLNKWKSIWCGDVKHCFNILKKIIYNCMTLHGN